MQLLKLIWWYAEASNSLGTMCFTWNYFSGNIHPDVYIFFCLISKHLNECEENMTQASKISQNYEELLTHLSGFLDIDIRGKEKPQEHLASKVIV